MIYPRSIFHQYDHQNRVANHFCEAQFLPNLTMMKVHKKIGQVPHLYKMIDLYLTEQQQSDTKYQGLK